MPAACPERPARGRLAPVGFQVETEFHGISTEFHTTRPARAVTSYGGEPGTVAVSRRNSGHGPKAAAGSGPAPRPRPRKCTFESAAARARPARGTTSLRVGRPALAIAESPSRYRVTPVPATRVSESRRCHGGCCMSPSSWNNQFNASEPKPANKNQPP